MSEPGTDPPSDVVAGRDGEWSRDDGSFQLVADALGGVLYDWDVVGGRVAHVGPAEALLGFRLDEIPPGIGWWQSRLHPDDRAQTEAVASAALAGDGTGFTVGYRVKHRDGHYVAVTNRARIVRDAAGRAVRVVGATSRVVDRTAAEQVAERARFAALFAQAPALMCVVRGPDHVFEFLNERAAAVIGPWPVIGRPVRAVLPEANASRFVARLDGVLATGDSYVANGVPVSIAWPRGAAIESRFVNLVYAPITEPDGSRSGVFVLCVDVTQQVEAHAALMASEARFRSLIEHATDVITVVDADGVIRYASPSYRRVVGRPADERVGRNVLELVHPDDAHRVIDMIRAVGLTPRAVASIDCRIRHGDGSWRRIASVLDNRLGDPSVGGIVVNSRDITERVRAEDALRVSEMQFRHHALHDPLTGLANRTRFHDVVERALVPAVTALPGGERDVAVLYVDLDAFKQVNDSFGHAAGDRLLVAVGGRLLEATRGCDCVARLGGDEFAVALTNAGGAAGAAIVARRIASALHAPVVLAEAHVRVSASIGIAAAADIVAADAVPSPEALLRNADLAMYAAKARGRGCAALFAPAMHAAARDQLALEGDLRDTMEDQAFRLAYQPIVELAAGTIVGFEALLRWDRPRHGPMSPADFVPVAEAAGLIVPLGRWVLAEACRQAARWDRSTAAGDLPLVMSVNVSARQLETGTRFVDDVTAVLAEVALAPERLQLEITESAVMRDPEAALAVLTALSELGVRLAIDDFGTGYSSLAYLERFPVDVLKIDKTFVDRLGTSDGGSRLAEAVVGLGEALALRVVAEGVESAAQATRLRALGCGYAQGYLFGRPLPAAEAAALRARRRGD